MAVIVCVPLLCRGAEQVATPVDGVTIVAVQSETAGVAVVSKKVKLPVGKVEPGSPAGFATEAVKVTG